ncbi:unnamed protein product, partial [Laminaria digitata]
SVLWSVFFLLFFTLIFLEGCTTVFIWSRVNNYGGRESGVIYLLMMAIAFIGYVLPWGQISFWGATIYT